MQFLHMGAGMQLIGMLDSPYVRRVAVALQLMGVPFEHQSISVFRTFDQFSKINPVVKAPTLVCDDGTVLMDSTIILQYAESLAGKKRSLLPSDPQALLRSLRITSLTLAACDKSVSIIYEHMVRPADKVCESWLSRVTGQFQIALDELEAELQRAPLSAAHGSIAQDGVTVGVVWHFIQQMLPEIAVASKYPALESYRLQTEALPEFKAAPHGDSVYQGG